MPRRPFPPERCAHPLRPARPLAPFDESAFILRWVEGVARDELRRRADARTSLAAYVDLIFDDYIRGAWLEELFEAMDWFTREVEAKRSPRLMVFAPPRGGKSHVVSRAFPTWVLGNHPDWEVIAAAATDDLASDFGLFVRNTLSSPLFQDLFPGCIVDAGSNAIAKIVLANGGGYRALGVGSNVVGKGAHVMIIDDPIAGRAEAYSAKSRQDLAGWFRTNARTRLAPGGGILLMHQRWHAEDLAGTLLLAAEMDKERTPWRVISFPAILPDGSSFFPERWPIKLLLEAQADLLPAEFAAMYQQRPINEAGGFFRNEWFQYYSSLPDKLVWRLAVDLASSKSTKANRTAIFPVGESETGDFYLAPDYVLDHLSILDSGEAIMRLAKKYDCQALATERGTLNNVLSSVLRPLMTRDNRWIRFLEVTRADGKHIVAGSYQAALQARKVWFPNNATTTRILVPQHLNFVEDADNTEDDGIDAMANLFLALKGRRRPAAASPPPPEEPTEDQVWEKILARGARPPATPFTRLNGLTYERRNG